MGVAETPELVIFSGAGVTLPLPYFFFGFFFPPEAKVGSNGSVTATIVIQIVGGVTRTSGIIGILLIIFFEHLLQ
jgi:hypothetical protein